MTMSMKMALDILNKEKSDINFDDLMFVFTVFRDNAKDDKVYSVLNDIVKKYSV